MPLKFALGGAIAGLLAYEAQDPFWKYKNPGENDGRVLTELAYVAGGVVGGGAIGLVFGTVLTLVFFAKLIAFGAVVAFAWNVFAKKG